MLELWYYAEGEETRGPISAVDLAALLSKIPDPRTVMIWRHGFEDWKPTDDVPEIARQVVRPRPPPLRPKVSPPPVSVREPVVDASDTAEFKDVKPSPSGLGGWLALLSRGAARATKFLMIVVLCGFVGKFGMRALIEVVSGIKRHVTYQIDRPVTSDFEYQIAFALRSVAFPAEVLAEELIVGSCPTPITVQRKGIWATAEPNEQARAEMAANPGRKASVAAVFTRADSAGFIVMGLGSLQKAQGRLSQSDFARIKERIAKGPTGIKGVQERIDNLAKGGGYTVSQYSFDSITSPDRDRFYAAGTSSGVLRDGSHFHGFAVEIMQLVHGCIVSVNIALPIPPDIEEAVANLVLR